MEQNALGKIIEARRTEFGLTQRDLAKKVKVSNSTISRLEKGDGITPDPSTLKAVAEVLDIDYNYLLALNKTIDDEPEIRIIQRAAHHMSADDKQKMVRALKGFFQEAFDDAEGDVPAIPEDGEQ